MLLSAAAGDGDTIDLAGSWHIQLVEGKEQTSWNEGAPSIPVQLPGSLAENNVGWEVGLDTPWMGSTGRGGWLTDEKYAPYRRPGSIKVPFWLQPCKYYRGLALYRREFKIPPEWKNKRIILSLERCHWESTVWIDGREMGTRDSLCTPHRYDVTEAMTPGSHTLVVGVENGYHVRVGTDSHTVTDHTQTNWNGIIGAIELRATGKVWIEDVQVYPNVEHRLARVVVTAGNAAGKAAACRIDLQARASDGTVFSPLRKTCIVDGEKTVVETDYGLGRQAPLWSEFSPNLIDLDVALSGEGIDDRRTVTFGLRRVSTDGRHFMVNGCWTFMRGTLECCIFPRTGYPPTDVAEWRRIFRVCKAHGLNHVRFHSWCPPKAAFIAGDEAGIYLQPECGVWRGAGGPAEARPVEPWLYEETERILREYGNHPSFALLAHGNEPWELDRNWLTEWTRHFKSRDDRRLITAGAHYPLIEENDFHIPGCTDGFWIRYHRRFNAREPSTLRNYSEQIAKRAAPCIAHEVGQWCVFPNLKETSKYTGVLKAENFEIVRDFLEENHLAEQAEAFLLASGRFQTLLYKEEIEAFLRTPHLGGFQLLDLHDFPGQGTALIGLVDAFWESKGYVTPGEFRRFCGKVVPLAVMPKRVWQSDETFEAEITIAQFAGKALPDATPHWKISDAEGKTVAEGEFETRTIPVGNDTVLGQVTFPLNDIEEARRLTLQVALPGTEFRNDWAFWVYPRQLDIDPAADIQICETLNEALLALEKGGKVLLLPGPDAVTGSTAGTFETIFWNKAWFPGQKEHTLGLLCDPADPALAHFPTGSHSSWQWWDLMMKSKPMILDHLDPALRPIIQPIDDWNSCRRLGLLFEASVGNGKLILCSIDLTNGLDERPVARQLRFSLMQYMASSAFAPKLQVTAMELEAILPRRLLGELKASSSASSAATNYPARLAIDGNPATIWHTSWEGEMPLYPHELTVDLKRPVKIEGVRLLPRQDGNHNGWIKEVWIYLSDDGRSWGEPAARATLSNNQEWKSVAFDGPVKGRHLRIEAVKPQNPDHPWASLAELEVVVKE